VINFTTSLLLPRAKIFITYRTVGWLGGRAGPDVLQDAIVDVTLKLPVHRLFTAQTTLILLICKPDEISASLDVSKLSYTQSCREILTSGMWKGVE
jgi:hypothetical protein